MNERREAGDHIGRADSAIEKWAKGISGMAKEMKAGTWFLSDKYVLAEITVNMNGAVQYELKFKRHEKSPEKGMVNSVEEALERIAKYRGEYIDDRLSGNVKSVEDLEPVEPDDILNEALRVADENPERLVELREITQLAKGFVNAIVADLPEVNPGKQFSRERGVNKWVSKLFDIVNVQDGSFTKLYEDTWRIDIPGLNITMRKNGVRWSVDVGHGGRAVEQFPEITTG